MTVTVPYWTREGTIDLAGLQPENLTAEIIASTLAKVNRFNGRTAAPWSVAAHSVLVAHLVPPELQPWALLHDAHEAFIGDITGPAVEMLCLCGDRDAVQAAIRGAKGQIDRVIASAWRVSVRSMSYEIRHADFVALQAEASVLLGVKPDLHSEKERDDFGLATTLLPVLLRGGWEDARDLWIDQVARHARRGAMAPPGESHLIDFPLIETP